MRNSSDLTSSMTGPQREKGRERGGEIEIETKIEIEMEVEINQDHLQDRKLRDLSWETPKYSEVLQDGPFAAVVKRSMCPGRRATVRKWAHWASGFWG